MADGGITAGGSALAPTLLLRELRGQHEGAAPLDPPLTHRSNAPAVRRTEAGRVPRVAICGYQFPLKTISAEAP